MTKPVKPDIYARVTGKIVADLEKGVRPWIKPWSVERAGGRVVRPLRHNGKPYQGVNILLLWGSALENGFSSPVWMTFKQARDLGGHVRQGEKGSLVVFADTIRKTETAFCCRACSVNPASSSRMFRTVPRCQAATFLDGPGTVTSARMASQGYVFRRRLLELLHRFRKQAFPRRSFQRVMLHSLPVFSAPISL